MTLNPYIFTSSGNLLITFLASFLVWFMFASIFALLLFHNKFTPSSVFYMVTVSFLAWLISDIFKLVFQTVRPFAIQQLPPLTLTIPKDFAFPSTHSALAFSLSSGVMNRSYKLGIIYFISSILVGYGRVASHVHYFIDIAGGASIGILTFYLMSKTKFAKRFLTN